MAPTPRLPREARRAQLIAAAASAFRTNGYDKTSMDQVAQEAGVSRLIVYRNFTSKEHLYRDVLGQLLVDLAGAFEGLSVEAVAERGAATIIMPVARSHADAFRLLWRDAWHQPPFEDLAIEFRSSVTKYAKAILSTVIDDPALLDWGARTAGALLIEGICNWLDEGDPSRDAEVARVMVAGIRSMSVAWTGSATR